MRWLVLLFVSFPLFASSVFVRAGIGAERARDTVIRDRDCTSTQPPALFGCGFEARGSLGNVPTFELAIGAGTRTRVELAFAQRSFELAATSNFTGVTGEQNVSADVRSLSMFVNGAIDLAPQSWRVRPFVTAGAGLASNATSAVVYSFPGIAPNAVTITPGGQRTDFAWNVGGGATFDLCPNLSLDLTLRHTDLGQMHSPRGIARIIRPTRTLELEIDETRGDLASRGVTLSLRWTR